MYILKVGDTVELKTYAEDQYGNYIEDLGDLGITYRWYMEDDETSKIDELGTGSSYTVNNVTEHIYLMKLHTKLIGVMANIMIRLSFIYMI